MPPIDIDIMRSDGRPRPTMPTCRIMQRVRAQRVDRCASPPPRDIRYTLCSDARHAAADIADATLFAA